MQVLGIKAYLFQIMLIIVRGYSIFFYTINETAGIIESAFIDLECESQIKIYDIENINDKIDNIRIS